MNTISIQIMGNNSTHGERETLGVTIGGIEGVKHVVKRRDFSIRVSNLSRKQESK